jgi:hypothetical protein
MLTGIGLAIGATACFAALDTTTKYVSASAPLLMALWVRYLVQALATSLVALPLRGLDVLRTGKPKFQALRGLLLMQQHLRLLQPAPHAGGRIHGHRHDRPLVITVLAATLLRENVPAAAGCWC